MPTKNDPRAVIALAGGNGNDSLAKSRGDESEPRAVSRTASDGSAQVTSSAQASLSSRLLCVELWFAKRSSDSTAAESGQSVTARAWVFTWCVGTWSSVDCCKAWTGLA